MKNLKYVFLFALPLLATSAWSHCDSLSVKGGETFKGGTKVIVKYWCEEAGDGFEYYYKKSSSLAEAWRLIGTGAELGTEWQSFDWNVPDSATTTGRFRAFQKGTDHKLQDTVGKSNSFCKITGAFTITSTTPILRLSKNPGSGSSQNLILVPAGFHMQNGNEQANRRMLVNGRSSPMAFQKPIPSSTRR